MSKTKLMEAIERAGLTQAEVAARSGIDCHRVNRYARGRAFPGPRTLGRLAAAIGCCVAEIREGRDNA